MRKLRRLLRNILRGLSYFKQGFISQDWDYKYLEQDILFKLLRIEKDLLNSKYTKHDRITLKSLRRTIELFEILINNEIQIKFFKKNDIEIQYLENNRINIITSNDYKVAEDISKEYYNNVECMAFLLLRKYREYWWD